MNSLAPRSMAVPDNEAALAAMIQQAYAAQSPLLVQGAGTKLGMLRPVQAAGSVSTRGLTGITLYAPKELVFSARAGTALAEVEAALAAQGQHLIAEPPDYSRLLGSAGAQTLGGIVATNLSGPRRVAGGAMRDHVLGMRVIDGTGQVIRAGGRVLKNVTGLDICKLLSGSHGTLGVMTEITLKVLPAPEATGSLLLHGLDAPQGVAALSAALGSPYGVSGAAYLPVAAASHLALDVQGAAVLVRIEDFAENVRYRLGRLQEEFAHFGDPVLLNDVQSGAAWTAIRHGWVLQAAEDDAIWRVSVRPSAGPGVLAAAQAAGAAGYLDWGGGLVMLAGPATEAAHAAITQAVAQAGGIWMLLRGPGALRNAVDVVPREAAPLAALTRRVKAVMDPGGILNPGRISAGV